MHVYIFNTHTLIIYIYIHTYIHGSAKKTTCDFWSHCRGLARSSCQCVVGKPRFSVWWGIAGDSDWWGLWSWYIINGDGITLIFHDRALSILMGILLWRSTDQMDTHKTQDSGDVCVDWCWLLSISVYFCPIAMKFSSSSNKKRRSLSKLYGTSIVIIDLEIATEHLSWRSSPVGSRVPQCQEYKRATFAENTRLIVMKVQATPTILVPGCFMLFPGFQPISWD